MQKITTSLLGLALVLLGGIALAGELASALFGWDFHWWGFFRIWPLIVVGVGVGLGFMALLSIRRRGMAALFIPALPVFTVGGILLFASVTGWWDVWSWAWTLVVLSVALGFLLAAIFGRNVWYLIPTILVGMNGLALAFCAFTGWWSAWSFLWAVEPLAVGLVLALVGLVRHSPATLVVGLAFCGFAGTVALGMFGLLYFNLNWWPVRVLWPLALIALGGLLLAAGLRHRTVLARNLEEDGLAV